jgi:hypothetical protein
MLATIQKEKKEFENDNIQIVNGYSFNQKNTVNKIYLAYNSKFLNGDMDDEGQRKFYFNINRNPCKVTTKAIDFDTKHINLETAGGGNPLKTWFFERDLKYWMKDQNFGAVLNRLFFELPIFGSVVIKIVDGKPEFVDIRNFIVEQSADSLDKAEYIIEKHLYTPKELEDVGEKLGWKGVNEAIEEFRKSDSHYITVYERYGEEEDISPNGKKTYEYRRTYIADVGVNKIDEHLGHISNYAGVILGTDKVEKHPYWEFHLEKIPGRWLGVGIVETLFDAQVRVNEISNLQAKSSFWSALRLWQTRDPGINRNLFVDTANGEILNSEQEITQIDMADRNLSGYETETSKWMQNRDELTFSYDVVRGERLPAGTPLGSARLAAAQSGSHFDQLRENIALKVKEMIYAVMIKEFKKNNNSKHTLRIAGEDLDKVRNLMINQKSRNALIDYITRKKKFPSKTHYMAIKAGIEEKVKQSKELLLKIPKDFYSDIKYTINIIISGESKDTSIWGQTMFAALQAITADPTLLTDPVKKKFFAKYLESGGASIIDFEPEVQPLQGIEQLTPAKGMGGGISRPAVMPNSPTAEMSL